MLIKTDLNKSLELLNELDYTHKIEVLKSLVRVAPKETLSLLYNFSNASKFREESLRMLNAEGELLLAEALNYGSFSWEELSKIATEYCFMHYFDTFVEKIADKVNEENISLEKAITLIGNCGGFVKNGYAVFYRNIITKLLAENSLDKVLAQIATFKASGNENPGALHYYLFIHALNEAVERTPEVVMAEISILDNLDSNNKLLLYFKLAESLWDKDVNTANDIFSKSEQLAKKYFYTENTENTNGKTTLSKILDFKLDKLQREEQLVDIIFSAVEFGNTMDQISPKVISCVAKNNRFEGLKTLYDASIDADYFIRQL